MSSKNKIKKAIVIHSDDDDDVKTLDDKKYQEQLTSKFSNNFNLDSEDAENSENEAEDEDFIIVNGGKDDPSKKDAEDAEDSDSDNSIANDDLIQQEYKNEVEHDNHNNETDFKELDEESIQIINKKIDINNVTLNKAPIGYKPIIVPLESLSDNDLYDVFDNYNQINGFVSHHTKSADNFYTNGIKYITMKGFTIEKVIIPDHKEDEEKNIVNKIIISVIFKEVRIEPPVRNMYRLNRTEPLYPTDSALLEKNYSGSVFVDAEIITTVEFASLGKNEVTKKTFSKNITNFRICTLPIITGSILCNTYGHSKKSLVELREDPTSQGGFLQLKNSYSINLSENMVFNYPKIYKNAGYGKSKVRCEYISKSGDSYQNSDYIMMIYNSDDTLTIQIQRDKLMDIYIPFYLIFRAMGWTTDKELFDHIVMDREDESNRKIEILLRKALQAKYSNVPKDTINKHDMNDATMSIVHMMPEDKYKKFKIEENPDNKKHAIESVRSIFDNHCLPHIGFFPQFRKDKLETLAMCIRRMLMVETGMLLSTDRDSYIYKRITACGESFAKSFKTYYNQVVVMPLNRGFYKAFKSTLYSKVDVVSVFKTSINPLKFDELVSKTVTNANKAELKISNTTKVINRLSAQIITPKNQLYVISLLRQIVSLNASDNARQSERAAEMRRVHMSALGFVCVVHSPPEGDSVGINKQLATFATIAHSSSSEVLKKILMADTDIIFNLPPSKIFKGSYARIYVNGYIIGYVIHFYIIHIYKLDKNK